MTWQENLIVGLIVSVNSVVIGAIVSNFLRFIKELRKEYEAKMVKLQEKLEEQKKETAEYLKEKVPREMCEQRHQFLDQTLKSFVEELGTVNEQLTKQSGILELLSRE